MKSRTLVLVFLIMALLIIAGSCTTGKKAYIAQQDEALYGIADDLDWPRWRGPNGDGISMETGWDPEALEGGPKIVWKTNVGLGYSNAVIKGKYLYTMGNEDGEDNIYCLNGETGKEVWRYSYPHRYVVGYGGATQSTPIVEGMYVYALSIEGILLCLEAKNGKLRWKKDLVSEYDVVKPYFNFVGSPVIEGDLIILTANTSGIALDKKTGKNVSAHLNSPYYAQIKSSFHSHNSKKKARNIFISRFKVHACNIYKRSGFTLGIVFDPIIIEAYDIF